MLAVEYDESMGIVKTTAQGILSKAEFDEYMPLLTAYRMRSAARHGVWLHLVDATRNPVQPKDSAEHIAESLNTQPRDNGHVAYIVQSALLKMQIKRIHDTWSNCFFEDGPTATAWLLKQAAGNTATA